MYTIDATDDSLVELYRTAKKDGMHLTMLQQIEKIVEQHGSPEAKSFISCWCTMRAGTEAGLRMCELCEALGITAEPMPWMSDFQLVDPNTGEAVDDDSFHASKTLIEHGIGRRVVHYRG